MKDRAETLMPAHLQDLLQPTPSGMAKLLAAWDGLTLETQIAVLVAKREQPDPRYLSQRLIEKALRSGNAFVRYMAARAMGVVDFDEAAKTLRAQTESDPEPLVRYAHLEGQGPPSKLAAEKFFALPHEARLAIFRGFAGEGESIAALIAYGVEHGLKDGRVSETELFELLSDYLASPAFKEAYVECDFGYEGYLAYCASKDLEALWDLVPKVPESLSHVIIEHLPERITGEKFAISQHVLDSMNDRQLLTLFSNPEVGVQEFRKQKFLEVLRDDCDEKDYARHSLRAAATSHAFDLTNEEFAEILSKQRESRVAILEDLATTAQDLRPCLYEAIHDILVGAEAEWARGTLNRKLEALKDAQNGEELTELRLYRLAVQAVPWEKDEEEEEEREEGWRTPSGELAFLKEVVVEGDTWATFMAFSRKWGDQAFLRTKGLERFLPRIWGASEESKPVPEPAQEKILEELISLKAEVVNTRRMQHLSFWLIVALLVGLFLVRL